MSLKQSQQVPNESEEEDSSLEDIDEDDLTECFVCGELCPNVTVYLPDPQNPNKSIEGIFCSDDCENDFQECYGN